MNKEPDKIKQVKKDLTTRFLLQDLFSMFTAASITVYFCF